MRSDGEIGVQVVLVGQLQQRREGLLVKVPHVKQSAVPRDLIHRVVEVHVGVGEIGIISPMGRDAHLVDAPSQADPVIGLGDPHSDHRS
jgi:hypothetical protein